MEIEKLRQMRVEALIEECGSVKAFAERVGIQPGQASHIRTGFRNVGKVMARRIENAFGKERGWMDVPLSPSEIEGDAEVRYKIVASNLDDLVVQLSEKIETASILEFLSKLSAELHKKSS